MAAIRLTTREARKKLPHSDPDKKSRIEPFWHQHAQGVSIGYRPATETGVAGHWVLREFKPGTPHGRYVKRRLGIADDVLPADGVNVLSWEDVLKIALDGERPTVTRPAKHTVSAAWEAYKATRKTPPILGRWRPGKGL